MTSKFRLPNWEDFFATSPMGRKLIEQHDQQVASDRDRRIRQYAADEAKALLDCEAGSKARAAADDAVRAAQAALKVAMERRRQASHAAMGAAQRLSNLRAALARDLADRTPGEVDAFMGDVLGELQRIQSSRVQLERTSLQMDKTEVRRVLESNDATMDAIQQRQSALLAVYRDRDSLLTVPGDRLRETIDALRTELSLT